jgi:aspartate racemase
MRRVIAKKRNKTKMKRIGILGGIGPESTVDYYKEIIRAFVTTHPELAYPEIIVYSANMNELMGFVSEKINRGQTFIIDNIMCKE